MKKIAIFATCNIISLLLNFLASLWCANLAGPRWMGTLNTLQLLVSYAPIITFGMFNGLNREIPYLLGQDNKTIAYLYTSTAHFFCYTISLLSGVLLFLFGASTLFFGNYDWGLGLLAFCFVIPLTIMRFFVEVTYRTGHDFEWLAITKLITSVLTVVSVSILYWVVWEGMLFRAILIAFVGFYLLWSRRKMLTKPKWDMSVAKHLLTIGFPIFLVGYLYTGLLSLDRLIIVHELGIASLGSYTPAIIILQGMAALPTSVLQVIYPKAVEEYARTGSASTILPLLFKPLPILTLVQLPFVIIAWLFMPELINTFMPKFTAGISAAQWAVLAGFILSLSTPSLAFNILKKQLIYGVVMIIAALVLLLASKVLIASGFGLASIAIASSISFGFLVIGCACGSYVICRCS